MARSAVRDRTRDAEPLSREAIVEAAIVLAEREGPEALSMRRLGRELGVEGMAVYHYVSGRDELLRLIADRLFEPLTDAPSTDGWRDTCTSFAATLRSVALSYPATFALVGLRPFDTSIALRAVELLLQRLVAAGFNPAEALSVYRIVASYARGYALAEAAGFTVSAADPGALRILRALPQDEFPVLGGRTDQLAALDAGATFAMGLRALIDGLPEPGGAAR
jgi:AcrR family transcriptional regulator